MRRFKSDIPPNVVEQIIREFRRDGSIIGNPTLSRTKIAFSYAGDIWLVDRSGGTGQRLTNTPAREVYPTFSPDGSQVAFARFNPFAAPFGWDVMWRPFPAAMHGASPITRI